MSAPVAAPAAPVTRERSEELYASALATRVLLVGNMVSKFLRFLTDVVIARALGKRPVLVDRDVDGFVWNRMQLALLREAVWLVEHGVASPRTVDEIVRDGLARRWRYTGPFQTAALGGADTFERVAANLWPVLSCTTELEDLRRWLDESPDVTGPVRERRDQGLAAELRNERAAGTGS